MNKREDKKEAILLAGMGVMKAQGYNGTSVKDIVDAAAVPKGSFYNYFESKEAFALEAIEHAAREGRAQLELMLSDRSRCALERLNRFFVSGIDCACDSEFKVGCFLGNMCQEMSDSSELIRSKIDQALKSNVTAIAMVIEQGQLDGRINQDIDAKTLAEFLLNAWEGTLMRAKAAKSREPLDAFMSTIGRVLA